MFNRGYIESIRVHFPASYVSLPECISNTHKVNKIPLSHMWGVTITSETDLCSPSTDAWNACLLCGV